MQNQKIVKLKQIIWLVIGLVALHIYATSSGMYACSGTEDCFIWIDNVAHGLGGVLCGMVWVWLLQYYWTSLLRSKWKLFIATVAFVLVTALIWELFEFTILKLWPQTAYQLALYSPNFSEASADIVSNLIGGIVYASFLTKRVNHGR